MRTGKEQASIAFELVQSDSETHARRPALSALTSFVSALSSGSSLRLRFHWGTREGNSFRVTAMLAGSTLDEFDRHAVELGSAIHASFPGYSAIAVEETETANECSLKNQSRLYPPAMTPTEYLAEALRQNTKVFSEPRAVSEFAPRRLVLPHPMCSWVRIDHLANQLATVGKPFVLEVVLSSIALTAADLRTLSILNGSLSARMSEDFLHYPDLQQLHRCSTWLNAWQIQKSGVSAEVYLSGESDFAPWQLSTLSEETFGNSGTTDAAKFDPEMNLSIAVPRGTRSCLVFPQKTSLLKLESYAAARRFSAAQLEGTKIGTTRANLSVSLADKSRGQHVYLCGGTGTGKSSALENMILQDIRNGYGVGLIDPHGDSATRIFSRLSAQDLDRTTFANLADPNHGFSLNILENEGLPEAAHSNFVCNQLISTFKRVLYRDVHEAFGPMFETYYKFSLTLLMRSGREQVNLADLDRVFSDRKWRQELIANCTDEHTVRFWKGIAERVTHSDISLDNIAPYILSKQTSMTANPVLRPILCAPTSSIRFFDAMQNGKVFLANLAKGTLGDMDSSLVGSLLLTKIFAAALRRAALPPSERRPFRLYLDEVQAYSSELVSSMLSEGRKFGLELTLANQSISQVDGRNHKDDIAHAILANSGTVISFRQGPVDAALMSRWMGTDVSARELAELPNYEAVGRMAAPDGAPVVRRFQTLCPSA
ncbi:type IV secretion system DNA-binding domain-containing protein [Aliisedimentitalea sp. MJ-SS2]|uniref:type IV secretory system conjugative DNA transfer family protein n=1 Tax=Aliisedimentitalea sp. MJ-SS2 TaxID=3049795 RepID=UPI00292D5200|nr:type IV secretion system DNA-binding domain-containing protein [Alisedimentitalea sp. MJ-SS2]